MPRKPPISQLDAVLHSLATFEEGASIGDLLDILTPRPARRSLQRWLAILVGQGRILQVGAGRSARYKPITLAAEPNTDIRRAVAATPLELHVSVEASNVRSVVRQPIFQRTPVGYRQEFLIAYSPNQTYYLSKDDRNRLASIGAGLGPNMPAGTHAQQMLNRLLIDLSWNSSRLEGNTYSLLETERLIELGSASEGKSARETQMILNHKRAIEMLARDAAHIGFNRYTILNLHAALSENLFANPRAAGQLRQIAVGIDGSVFHPMEGPQRIAETFDALLSKAEMIADPFEQAFFIMVHLPYLQPFEDVNKRVSRLAANIPFIRRNLCPISFVDVPQQDYIEGLLGVYELNRVDVLREVFTWAYARSAARYSAIHQTMGEPDPFWLRHRQQLGEVIAWVVQSGLDKADAARYIRQQSKSIPDLIESVRFAEMVESELTHLHEGSIARFRIRPSEYQAWKSRWE